MQRNGIVLACALSLAVASARAASLRLVRTIPLPNVTGRLDHLAIDLAGRRLFLCALGNNSVEVIDLEKGERVHSITGLGAPQGVGYVPESNRLFVANEQGGLCNIYDAVSFAPLGRVDLQDDADNVRYDSATGQIYVGYGNGGLALVDAQSAKKVRTIDLPGHPEAFALEKNGPRIFVNVPTSRRVAVVDRAQAKVIAQWKTGWAVSNFPVALDEANHRLFVGCRLPSRLVVLNTQSGEEAASVAISGDTDDIFYDQKRHCVYAICGEGNVETIEQVNADTYKLSATTKTSPGARTGLFVPELDSLFLAVPARSDHHAEVRRYAID